MENILSRTLARLRGDEKGVAAVEFAFIAPVIVMLAVGVATFTESILMQRRLQVMTDSVAWTVAELAPPSAVTSLAVIDYPTQTILTNVVKATLRSQEIPEQLKLTVRHIEFKSGSLQNSGLTLTDASGKASGAALFDVVGHGDPGYDNNELTGMANGDSAFEVNASLDDPLMRMFFGKSTTFILHAHSAR